MRPWETTTVPSLADHGRAPDVQVYDSQRRALRLTVPGGTARLYVCGITPYDSTHLGHAATYLAFDVLNRAWRDAGREVHYVQNVTDVDDPLLERAQQTGEDWRELADREIERFRGDMAALRVLPPDDYVGVVESLPLVVELIQQLQHEGAAYQVDGDLYYSVRHDPQFGLLSKMTDAEMLEAFGERGGDPEREGKRDPLDCLLWRAERPGEPAWDSPFGRGRPGWHIECSAIALGHLGEHFDVQGGGSDLVFPHHEMSAGEAQAAFPGLLFAQCYVHTGMVAYQGEKMSKSLGNLVFVSRLREQGVDPAVVRLALLAHHYRTDWEWTDDDVPRAEKRLAKWRSQLERTTREQADQLVSSVRSALAIDLDTPRALALLDDWADGWYSGDGSGAQTVRDLIDARLGVRL
jgi:L-cysteine:1D-myo-inositol 2-amino-2-deoxy-alpha-D-glucopyranoside ligase